MTYPHINNLCFLEYIWGSNFLEYFSKDHSKIIFTIFLKMIWRFFGHITLHGIVDFLIAHVSPSFVIETTCDFFTPHSMTFYGHLAMPFKFIIIPLICTPSPPPSRSCQLNGEFDIFRHKIQKRFSQTPLPPLHTQLSKYLNRFSKPKKKNLLTFQSSMRKFSLIIQINWSN